MTALESILKRVTALANLLVNFRKKILFFYLVILPSVYIVMGFKLTTSSAEFSSCNHYTYLRLILFVNAVWTVLLTNNFQSVVVIPVGRAVASNSRGPRFKSSHWQNLYWTFYCQLYWKDENKEKEAGYGPLKKQFPVNISLEFLNYCCAFVRLGTELKDYFHLQKRSLENNNDKNLKNYIWAKKIFYLDLIFCVVLFTASTRDDFSWQQIDVGQTERAKKFENFQLIWSLLFGNLLLKSCST